MASTSSSSSTTSLSNISIQSVSQDNFFTEWILIQTKSGKKLLSNHKAALKYSNIKIDEYVGDGTYLCRCDSQQQRDVDKLRMQLEDFISSVVVYEPRFTTCASDPAWRKPNPMSYRLFAYSYAQSRMVPPALLPTAWYGQNTPFHKDALTSAEVVTF